MHGEEEVQMFSPIPTWMLGAPSGFLHGATSPQGPSTRPVGERGLRSGTGARVSPAELGAEPQGFPQGGCNHRLPEQLQLRAAPRIPVL